MLAAQGCKNVLFPRNQGHDFPQDFENFPQGYDFYIRNTLIPRKSQIKANKPTIISSSQEGLKKAKFVESGFKKANMATLQSTYKTPQTCVVGEPIFCVLDCVSRNL